MVLTFRKGFSALLLTSFLVVSGCSGTASLVEYNNKLVGYQQEILKLGTDLGSGGLGEIGTESFNVDLAVAGVDELTGKIQKMYDEFKTLSVPQGGEKMGEVMKRYFELELEGGKLLKDGLLSLKGKETDLTVLSAFMEKATDFSSKEQAVLMEFGAAQQEMSSKYGIKIQ